MGSISNSRVRVGDIAGSLGPKGYLRVKITAPNLIQLSIQAHHICWYKHHGVWPDRQLDHRNTIKHDNRIRNLRPATHAQNSRNHKLHRDSNTGVSGVDFSKRANKYRVRIGVHNKIIHIGYYESLTQAKRARHKAEIKYFGRFRYKIKG